MKCVCVYVCVCVCVCVCVFEYSVYDECAGWRGRGCYPAPTIFGCGLYDVYYRIDLGGLTIDTKNTFMGKNWKTVTAVSIYYCVY